MNRWAAGSWMWIDGGGLYTNMYRVCGLIVNMCRGRVDWLDGLRILIRQVVSKTWLMRKILSLCFEFYDSLITNILYWTTFWDKKRVSCDRILFHFSIMHG